ncbi:MAG: tetratricopeptide repeat protein [Planctomycetales bacterium]|nr:tetratricopeptide repeat protein [Planctomycetales bacterium]
MRRLPPFLWVSLAAGVAYWPTLGNGLCRDDVEQVFRNPLTASLANIPRLLGTSYWAGVDGPPNLYRPLTLATIAVERSLGGGPALHHAGNLLLHAAASALALPLFRRLGLGPAAALAAALLLALHPARSEAVCEVVGRAEILAFLGVAGALLLEARHRGRPGGSPRALAGMGAALLGGLLAKETAVVFPLALLVVHLLGAGPILPAWPRRLRSYAVTAAVLGTYFAIRVAVLGGLGTRCPVSRLDNPVADSAGAVRLWTGLEGLVRYAGLALFPGTLSADYSLAAVVPRESPWGAGPLLGAVLVLVLVLVLARGRVQTPLALASAWLLASLAPFSNIPFAMGYALSERLLYTPLLGVALASGALLDRALAAGGGKRAAALAAAAGLLVAAGLRTLSRTLDWRSPETLAEATVAAVPESARAWFGLGEVRASAGRLDEARASYERALAIHAGYAEAAVNLGSTLLRLGRAADAEAAFRRAVEISPPGLGGAFSNLGSILLRRGEVPEAVRLLEEGARREPRQPAVQANLAEGYYLAGRLGEALAALDRAAALAPGDARIAARREELRRRLAR